MSLGSRQKKQAGGPGKANRNTGLPKGHVGYPGSLGRLSGGLESRLESRLESQGTQPKILENP